MSDGLEKQALLLSYLVQDPPSFALCRSILDPSFFVKELRPTVKFMLDHGDRYKSCPNVSMIYAETQINLPEPDDADRRTQWVCDEVERFCRNMAVANAIYSASEKMQEGDLDSIVDTMKKAVLLGLHRDLGTDYWRDPAARLRDLRENGAVSTGFAFLDKLLRGGVFRGGVQIVAAPSGVGKSMFLANQAVNYVLRGLNVLYLTLELPESWISKRMDAMITGIPSYEIFDKIDETTAILLKKRRDDGVGHMFVKYLPNGSNMNQIRAFVKNLEIQGDLKLDALIIDYMDEMSPVEKVSSDNLSNVGKFVTGEIRSFAMEEDLFCWTASQMIKGAVSQVQHDQDMLSGGKTKVNIADNVMTLYQSAALKERGYIILQLVKTRTSQGQNQSLALRYDEATVRYSDATPEESASICKEFAPDLWAPGGSDSRAPRGPSTAASPAPPSGGKGLDTIRRLKDRLGK